MKITERKLRSIIRSVILEAESIDISHANYDFLRDAKRKKINDRLETIKRSLEEDGNIKKFVKFINLFSNPEVRSEIVNVLGRSKELDDIFNAIISYQNAGGKDSSKSDVNPHYTEKAGMFSADMIRSIKDIKKR